MVLSVAAAARGAAVTGWFAGRWTRRSAATLRASRAARTCPRPGVVELAEQLAHLARVELAEAVEEVGAGGRQADDDLAAVGGVLAAGGEAVVDDAVDEAADGGQRDAEAGDELRHVEVAAAPSR